MGKILIYTRGDDLGSTLSANRAIFSAYKNGVLRNTSLMVCCPYADDALERFKGEKGICLGLHATVNSEWDSYKWGPVLPKEEVMPLVDETGIFLQETGMLHERNIPIEVFIREVEAQLDLAARKGFDIRYLDYHMMFLWAQEGLKEAMDDWRVKKGLYAGSGKKYIPFERYSPDETCLMPEADTITQGDRIISNLVKGIGALEEGEYSLVGHPSYNNEETMKLGHRGYTGKTVAVGRDIERRYFEDPAVLEIFAEKGIIAARFDESGIN